MISSGKVTRSPEMDRIYGVTPDEDATTADFFFNRLSILKIDRSLEQKYEKTKQSPKSELLNRTIALFFQTDR